MRYAVSIAVFAAMPAFAECPEVADHSERHAEIIAQLQAAPNEMSARPLSDELWRIWTDAPDTQAQELLDSGMMRLRSYDFEGAVQALDALVDYCPHYAEGYNQRAFARFLQQDYASALEDLDRALDLSPDHIAARAGRALTLMGLGRMEVAQSELRAALALNPWLSERRMLIEPPGDDI